MKKRLLKVVLIGLAVVMAAGILVFIFVLKPEEKEPVSVLQREKITGSSVKNCVLKAQTNLKEVEVKTNVGELYPRIDCFDPFVRAASPSGRYLAYEDISGGVDSTVEVYSVDEKKSVRLDVLGTSEIFDMAFRGGELMVLNGYEGISDEFYLKTYDVAGLFSEYPENVKVDGNYFGNVKAHSRVKSLPDKGENYTEVRVEDSKVELYGESGDLLWQSEP